ncbi:hypothetical protein J416_09784 [Gracilibacillus halophilus YIM-C55.5]|uniref:Uncharacterized protein n=1 Tax=Gracilibacillus halophilus YIM-C55.5 TaxID=1308866 RepID=N4WU69_9BACI|nr:hypothetical protein [Gracilibacillus halophilus]ENH96656.1 hypothetical protein J416_09784 [Gracilibacillus halophilus YIM-C55.5]
MTIEALWVIALLTGSLIVWLKHWPLLLVQVAIGIGIYFLDGVFLTIIMIGQILFGLWILYRLWQAVDYNYDLELEKTHRIPQKHTKGGQDGTRNHFL